jgi:hypothetical protein
VYNSFASVAAGYMNIKHHPVHTLGCHNAPLDFVAAQPTSLANTHVAQRNSSTGNTGVANANTNISNIQ